MTVGSEANLRDELNRLTPRLRRYSRALTVGHPMRGDVADELVHVTLMRALGARNLGAISELVIRLYATLTQLNREVVLASRQAQVAGCAGRPTLVTIGSFTAARQTKLSAGLMALPLDAREALLLVGLEGFGYEEAARILRISRTLLLSRLTKARSTLDIALSATPAHHPARSRAHLRVVT